MPTALRLRVAGIITAGLVVLAWNTVPLLAERPAAPGRGGAIRQVGGSGGNPPANERPDDVKPTPDDVKPTLHVLPRVTERSARTWIKLQEPITLGFAYETPLEDVLKHIEKATQGKNDKGLAVYVDPIGLQEAEKTMTSPVVITLDDVPLATALELILDQLGLMFYVQEDGLVAITAQLSDKGPRNPDAKTLDDLGSLRAEIALLRRELALSTRRGGGAASDSGAIKKAAIRRVTQSGGDGPPNFGNYEPSVEAVTLFVPLSGKAARAWQMLQEPISMSFANETPLEDVLKYIRSATRGPNDNGLPIYVDPVGLFEAEKTMTSPIKIDLEGVPLKTTLRLMLKQLGLKYVVLDSGIVRILSAESSAERVARTWQMLQEPVAMNFPNETPLEKVLEYIRRATQGPNDNGLQIYVDPDSMRASGKEMTSRVTLDLEGVPLKTTLRLMLKQLGLKYVVLDSGNVEILPAESIAAAAAMARTRVRRAGNVKISAESSDEASSSLAVPILNRISAIRRDVATLRREVAARSGF